MRRKESSFRQILPGPAGRAYYCPRHANCALKPLLFWFGDALRAPTVAQIPSADPGRITERPICVT